MAQKQNILEKWIQRSFIQNITILIYFFSPDSYVHPPRVPSKRAFQRSLHESYQYMMKLNIDAEKEEARRRKKLAAMEKSNLELFSKQPEEVKDDTNAKPTEMEQQSDDDF